jgi:hypothetical protein
MRPTFLFLILITLAQVGYGQQELKVPILSPITEISQEVALTQIKLTYSRPSAKGRKVFGGLVPYNEVWRTGANASTKLTFTEDVKIEGNPLKAGTYALYTIPGEKEWTVIIHTNTKHRSIAGDVYKPAEDAFRFKVTPRKTSNFVETFTIGFSDITTNSTSVFVAWENTEIKFRIDFDVDTQVDKQIAELTGAPAGMTHQNQFLAAEYYLHNNKDLTKADAWILAAMEKSPKNARYGLLRAKILAKAGKTDEALRVIADANAWATEAKNANYIEQTKDFWDSIRKP